MILLTHIFLSSKKNPNALLSVPFLRTPSPVLDSVAATAHGSHDFKEPSAMALSLPLSASSESDIVWAGFRLFFFLMRQVLS